MTLVLLLIHVSGACRDRWNSELVWWELQGKDILYNCTVARLRTTGSVDIHPSTRYCFLGWNEIRWIECRVATWDPRRDLVVKHAVIQWMVTVLWVLLFLLSLKLIGGVIELRRPWERLSKLYQEIVGETHQHYSTEKLVAMRIERCKDWFDSHMPKNNRTSICTIGGTLQCSVAPIASSISNVMEARYITVQVCLPTNS